MERMKSENEGTGRPPAMLNYHRDVRLRRVGGVAKVSGLTMVVFGALSLVLTIMNPLSAEFAVSIAIFVLGISEWRLGRRLASGDAECAIRLMFNQIGVAAAVTTYAVWQVVTTTDASVLAIIDRPELSPYLDLLDPLVRAEVIDRLPGLIRLTYLLIIPVIWLGCGAMSAYYVFRGRVAVYSAAQGTTKSQS
jgi:hypothetical protein